MSSAPVVENVKLAVIGLGYVGLPLAVEFGKHYPVIGFDINQKRIDALKAGVDATLEVSEGEMAEAKQLQYSCNPADLHNTRVVDVINGLNEYHVEVDVHDPWVNPDEAKREYGIELVKPAEKGAHDGIVIAVGYKEFRALAPQTLRAFGKEELVFFDLKYGVNKQTVDLRL